MTTIRILEFLLFLLLHQVYSEEPEPVFKAEGSIIEMGYCFGVDYIVVYRSAPGGDQLLGNSSDDHMPSTLSAHLQGRISIRKHQHLLGLQISHLTRMDSGIYRRECWQNQTLVSQHTQQLSVCDEEVKSEEIIVKEQDGRAKILCNSTYIGMEGTSVLWYHEMYPSYRLTLFLDSSVSLDPLVRELQGLVEVQDNGTLLLLDNSTLKNNQHFYCLVVKGKNCLSFQTMYQPQRSETREMFSSQGDRVVLKCPSDGDNQQWETPLGGINGSSEKNNQMYISFGEKSEDFSLIIPAVSDEHSGEYSCISSSLEIQYLLVLCPKKEPQEIVVSEGSNALLDCGVGEDDYQGVQWHHQGPSGEFELIHDSKDETVPVPQDLRGRVTLSENGSMLIISHLNVKDQGTYRCVVLRADKFLEEGDDYDEDYDGEETGEDEFRDDQYWHKCVCKQETVLSLVRRTRIEDLEPVAFKPGTRNPETADRSAGSNVTVYAVGAGLGVLLVVAVIVAVIVIKKRAKSSPKQREAASHSRQHTTMDIKMNVDPGCTQSLTHSDECDA